jgi:succinate-acetate transporter protein
MQSLDKDQVLSLWAGGKMRSEQKEEIAFYLKVKSFFQTLYMLGNVRIATISSAVVYNSVIHTLTYIPLLLAVTEFYNQQTE